MKFKFPFFGKKEKSPVYFKGIKIDEIDLSEEMKDISPFVRGVIKSIKTEPENWKKRDKETIIHYKPHLFLSVYDNDKNRIYISESINDILTKKEKRLLADTVREFTKNPKNRGDNDKMMTFFEKKVEK